MMDKRDARRRRYVDLALQGRLIGAAVCTQLLLAIAVLLVLRARMLAEIDAGLYRIHSVAERPAIDIVLNDGLWLMLAYFCANLLLMAGLVWTWRRRLSRLLGALDPILERATRLDFTPPEDTGVARVEHAALGAAYAWREHERMRQVALRALAANLPRGYPADGAVMLALARRQAIPSDAARANGKENNYQL
jgi:hypothetical protein